MAAMQEKRMALAGSGVVLSVFILAHFSHHLVTGALVPLLPQMRDEMGLDYFRAGLLVSAFTLSYGFVQVPLAWLSDRVSRRKLLAAGLVGLGLAAMLVAAGAGFWYLVVLLVAVGALGSTYHAPASAFLSQTFPQAHRGRSLGIHTVGGSASLLVTPALAVLVAGLFDSWRAAFVVLGVPPILAGILMLVAVRRQDAANLRASAASRGESIGAVAIARTIGVLVIIAMVATLLAQSVMTFLPLYLVDKHGVSPEIAGIIVGLVAGGGIIGAPLGGALSDRLGRTPIITASLVLAGPLLYSLTVVPFGALLLALIFVYGLVLSARMPVMESVIADVVPAAQRGTALGVYYFLSMETAGVATPAVGYLIDSFGADRAFIVLAVIGGVGGLLALALRGRYQSPTPARP